MTLVGKPIPPLDHEPHYGGAPPGIGVDLTYYHAWANSSTPLPGTPWYPTRPIIDAIGAVLHTNAASVEASLISSKNHGNRGIYNTKPHYNFNSPRPEKNVPTNRRAIANSTGSSIEDQYGCPDSSFWLLAFETADRGYNASPQAPDGSGVDLGPFLYDHDELIARALAYEAIACNFPLVIPSAFYTPGVYTHTAPWPYPHLTIRRGKTCPTYTKKQQILASDSQIMARARELYAAWTGSPPPVLPPDIPFDPVNGEYGLWPLNTSKPWIQVGSFGDAVKYAQGVLRNEGGQKRPNGDPLLVDGDFGPETEQAVRNLQVFFGLKNTGSVNYGGQYADDTWGVIDGLVVGFPEEPVEPPVKPLPPDPEPEPVPPPTEDKPYVSVGTGRYYLEAGGSPWGTSMKVYGNADHVDELQALNPGTWQPKQIIKCPDIIGRTKVVEAGESPLAILRKFFPDDNPYDHLDDFYFWNGGKDRVLHPGEWVYCSINWENPA